MDGELCRAHYERIAEELGGGFARTADAVAQGHISIGDVLVGAAQSYFERMFGQNPLYRDIEQAARVAQHQAQSRRAHAQGQPPPPPPPRSQARQPPGGQSPPRTSGSQSSSPPPPPSPDRRLVLARSILGFEATDRLTKELIDDRRRQLAKVFHPDKPGGSTKQMQRVNQAADALIASLAARP